MLGSAGRWSRVALVVVLVVVSVGCAVSLVGWRATSDRLARVEHAQRSDTARLTAASEKADSNIAAVFKLVLEAQGSADGLADRISELASEVRGGISSGGVTDRIADLEAQLNVLRSCINGFVSTSPIRTYC